jgi:hypothetical protein
MPQCFANAISLSLNTTDRLTASVARDERARIVHQHFLRHATKGRERALEPGEPMLLLLRPERTHAAAGEWPSVATNTNALIFASPISTRRSPKSICSCRPGGVSNRLVTSASARCAWR